MRHSQLQPPWALCLSCFFLGQLLARGGFGEVSWLCPAPFLPQEPGGAASVTAWHLEQRRMHSMRGHDAARSFPLVQLDIETAGGCFFCAEHMGKPWISQ